MVIDDKPYIPWTPTELEALVRDMIARGVEGPKVDRKQVLAVATAAEQVEFAKDVSAIANTDDDAYRDHGFLILGATKSAQLCGGISALEPARIDNTRAALIDAVKKYIAPVPKFFAYGFSDPEVGTWGVIVIPPSNQQAHMFIKEFSPRPMPGDWFVRVGEVTVKARPEDFVRVFGSAMRRAIDPLQEELRELRVELRNLRTMIPTFAPPITRSSLDENQNIPMERPSLAASELVERELASSSSRLESIVLTETLRLASSLHKGDSQIPWGLNSPSRDLVRQVLENIESATRELARTYGALARFDTGHRHVDMAMRALTPLTEQKYPPPGTPFSQMFVDLRLYPLALLLISTMTVAVSVQDATLPRAMFDLPLILGINREHVEPLLTVISEVYSASGIFSVVEGQDYRDPIAKRMRDVVPAWTDDLVFGQRSLDCFYVAEFLLYLACLDAGLPRVVGNFAIHREAQFFVSFFLRRRPEWICGLFRTPIEKLLAAFDDSIKSQMTNSYFTDRGFKENAAAAWEIGMDQTRWNQLLRAR